jgi:hypothetical protein
MIVEPYILIDGRKYVPFEYAHAISAELAALKLAAWDVYEVVTDALDNPGDDYLDQIAKALNELGELLPASRPEVKP